MFWADRVWQVRRLPTLLGDDCDRATVLLGDCNEWRPRARPVFALDRIWAQPGAVLRDFAVHRTPLARVAPDHLPLRATIAFEAD